MTVKINTRDVMRRADATASSFSEYDFIHKHCRNDLIEKMKPMSLNPKIGLDLGSALGSSSRYLSKRFKKCEILSLDISHSRLIESRKKRSILSRIREIQASANALPFINNSIDLIFANQLMPWIDNPNHFFSEISRILKKDGLFIFSTLGPDSLQIINTLWSKIDGFSHVNKFIDMHILGDNMLQSGLSDPVLDVEKLTLNYSTPESMLLDISSIGARNCLVERRPYLTGKANFIDLKNELNKTAIDGQIAIDLELIYGHAWGKNLNSNPNEYKVDISQIINLKKKVRT